MKNINKRGLLLVISGPAGSGKGEVVRRLTDHADISAADSGAVSFVNSVSATTRSPREGEIHGVNYFFLTKTEFESDIAAGRMLEYTEYCGNYYGTPAEPVERVLSGGVNLILEIEVEGALTVREKYPEAVLVMLLAPDAETQKRRLLGRGTETPDQVAGRLERTRCEMRFAERYDYIVCSRDGAQNAAADDIRAIVRAERLSSRRAGNIARDYFGE